MNPLAIELNEEIQSASPVAYQLLSRMGKDLFFPKGILSQSAEAKAKAHKFNATIGTATEGDQPLYLPATAKYFQNLDPKDVYFYAPPAGRMELRKLWKQKLVRENPSLKDKSFSLPVVTSAITHGLAVMGDLFLDPGDVVISPDKLWGNYRLTFETRLQARMATFPLFDAQGKFNTPAMAEVMRKEGAAKGKLVLLLNFPNNPTGYTPGELEAQAIVEAVRAEAARGTKILTVSDDSYFGLFYEDSITESLFGRLMHCHENVLSVKLDGATKEYYAWGFRTGFITFGALTDEPDLLYGALEKKTMGAIRGAISNCAHSSQTVVEKLLQDPDFPAQARQKFEIMKQRGLKTKQVLDSEPFASELKYYPFNSGYFMCLQLEGVDAEQLRLHLLDKYGVGTISIGKTDLRVAFSCIEASDLQELFELILAGVRDLKAKG